MHSWPAFQALRSGTGAAGASGGGQYRGPGHRPWRPVLHPADVPGDDRPGPGWPGVFGNGPVLCCQGGGGLLHQAAPRASGAYTGTELHPDRHHRHVYPDHPDDLRCESGAERRKPVPATAAAVSLCCVWSHDHGLYHRCSGGAGVCGGDPGALRDCVRYYADYNAQVQAGAGRSGPGDLRYPAESDRRAGAAGLLQGRQRGGKLLRQDPGTDPPSAAGRTDLLAYEPRNLCGHQFRDCDSGAGGRSEGGWRYPDPGTGDRTVQLYVPDSGGTDQDGRPDHQHDQGGCLRRPDRRRAGGEK